VAEVDLAVWRAGQVAGVEGGHEEHLAGALAVAGGDDGRVEIEEAAVLEELVGRRRQAVADPRHGAEGVRPGPQVGHLAQVLEAVALLLERIALGILDPADHLDLRRQHLDGLSLARRLAQLALDPHGAAGHEVEHLALVVPQRALRDDLDAAQARAVIDVEEREAALGVATRANPSLHRDGRADVAAREEVLYSVFRLKAVHLRHSVELRARQETVLAEARCMPHRMLTRR